jgi:RHS repeat-associated protein
MALQGRKYTSSSSYRYGFNGKENDKEVNEGAQDFGARIYDNRLGHWLSVDPLMQKYPYFSPYTYCANNPIYIIDNDGKKIWIYYMEGGKEKSFLYKPGMKASSYPETAQQAVKALNTIHSIERMAVLPQGYNSAEPSPKQVVADLANDKKFNLKIHAKTKEEWQNITQEQMPGPTPAAALPKGENESNVLWSPEIGFAETDEQGTETGLRSSPTTLLSHEVKHSWDQLKKRFGNIANKTERKNAQENSAMDMQNKVALNKENPEGERTDYSNGNKTVQKDTNKHDGKSKTKRNGE